MRHLRPQRTRVTRQGRAQAVSLQHGADLVLHSATKALCGHGDAIGGVVADGLLQRLGELQAVRDALRPAGVVPRVEVGDASSRSDGRQSTVGGGDTCADGVHHLAQGVTRAQAGGAHVGVVGRDVDAHGGGLDGRAFDGRFEARRAKVGGRPRVRTGLREHVLHRLVSREVALAMAEAELGFIPMEAAQAIAATALTFQPDMAALKAGTARDGMVVPEWVRQLRQAVGTPHGEHVHFGSTSQDVLDTSLVLRLRSVLGILIARLNAFDARLAKLAADHGSIAAMARTRMQRALPITWADRITAWRAPLARHQKRLQDVGEELSYFLKTASALGPKLGPTLFQLPPNFKKDLPRLEAFLRLLPQRWRAAVEFRHSSWYEDDVFAALVRMIDAGELERSDGGIAANETSLARVYAAMLRTYFESYRLATVALDGLYTGSMKRKEWVKQTLSRGQKMFLAGEIELRESLSRPKLESALDALRDHGLVKLQADAIHKGPGMDEPDALQTFEQRINNISPRTLSADSWKFPQTHSFSVSYARRIPFNQVVEVGES